MKGFLFLVSVALFFHLSSYQISKKAKGFTFKAKIYNNDLTWISKLRILLKLVILRLKGKVHFLVMDASNFLFARNEWNEMSFTTHLIHSKLFTKDLKPVLSKDKQLHLLNFHCERSVIEKSVLLNQFTNVVDLYHEMVLPKYSRYENWKRSCYMEVHEKWTPKTDINKDLYFCLKDILDEGKKAFTRWYCFRNNLNEVDVITMNSFVTKYIPKPGENEFGKHVDGVKIDGSLILALPEEIDLVKAGLTSMKPTFTSDRHKWRGLKVWDAPRDRKIRTKLAKDGRNEYLVHLNPGDCCFLEKMVWHHGLPITSGSRYVIVCFYQCIWKKLAL